MRNKLLFSLLLAVTFGIILSCASVPSAPQELSTEHERIVGTKWLTIVPNSKDSLEFIDERVCIFTSNGKPQRIAYTVKDNKVILGNNILSYEIREEALYLIGYPAFNKV